MLPTLLYVDRTLRRNNGIQTDVANDLDLTALIDVMAAGCPVLHDKVFHMFQSDMAVRPEDIFFRQAILRDAMGHADWFFLLNTTIEQAFQKYDSIYKTSQPGYTHFIPITEQLHTALQLQKILLDLVTAGASLFATAAGFSSSGMKELQKAYDGFFSRDFLITFRNKYNEFNAITQDSCMIIAARPGDGLKVADCQIRHVGNRRKQVKPSKGSHVIKLSSISMQTKAIDLRDTMLKNVLNFVNAINRQTACDMRQLGNEVAFFAGCLNLERELCRLDLPICFPQPMPCDSSIFDFHGLIDVGLALRVGIKPISNTLNLDDEQMIIITGANQGGKSTFLRSIGLAQIMMQTGLFVAAESFVSRVCSGVMTHFCRAEDQSLDSGKLDEELCRINRTIDVIQPHALLLMNESFSSTTSHDGTIIASEITAALLRLDTRIFFVTHLYSFAKKLEKSAQPHIAFLRAERNSDGVRSYRIREGTALPTSFGLDLFHMFIDDEIMTAS